MIIPGWLLQLGSLAGLVALCFTILDRLLSGRPLISIKTSGYQMLNLRIKNFGRNEILITRIKGWPAGVLVASSDGVYTIAAAAAGDYFSAELGPDAEREFPIVFRDGTLLNEERKVFPFVIVVSWRRSRSIWLPQFPVLLVSSARAMRLLHKTK
jgi:hypothetical protein